MSLPRVTGHAVGASRRNGLPEVRPYRPGRRLTPPQREAALAALIEQRNATLCQRRADRLAAAWHRDVPRTCICDHEYYGGAFIVTRPDAGCPYHADPARAAAARRRAVLLEADPGPCRRRSARGAA